MAVFYRVPLRFSVKALQKFGTNVVRIHLVKGERKWYIVGCFLSPSKALTIECVLVAVGKRPHCSKMLVADNFNADLTGPEGEEQDEYIAADLAVIGLMDMF